MTKIIDVDDGDPDYDQAFHRARQSIDRLARLWYEPYEGQRNFMIKVGFEGLRRPIFLWLDVAAIKDAHDVGEVFETTDELPAVTVGQSIEVPKELALDWMVNDHGTIHGGFTLLVERGRLAGTELVEFDDLLLAKRWVDE